MKVLQTLAVSCLGCALSGGSPKRRLDKTDGSLMSLALLRTEDSKKVEDCEYCVLQHLRFEAKKGYRQARVLVSLVGERHEKNHE